MGRKKAAGSTTAEEMGGEPPVAVPKKNKKKGQFLVDDDEYMVVDQPDDGDSVKSGQQHGSLNGKDPASVDADDDLANSFDQLALSQKKKTKGKKGEADIDDTISELSLADDKAAEKKKGRKGKKELQIEDDEYDLSGFDDAKSTVSVQSNESSKKGKKGGQAGHAKDHDLTAQGAIQANKKGKKGKGSKKEIDVDDDEYILPLDDTKSNGSGSVHEEVAAAATRKGKKSATNTKNTKTNAMFTLLGEMDGSADESEINDSAVMGGGSDEEMEAIEPITFTGKKKSKKGTKHVNLEPEGVDATSADGEEGLDELVFTGKKKAKGKKSLQSVRSDFDDEFGISKDSKSAGENALDESGVDEGLGKKAKGKKGAKALEEDYSTGYAGLAKDDDAVLSEEDFDIQDSLLFTGKKKPKKGKKDSKRDDSEESGPMAAQMADGLDDMLDEDAITFSGKKKAKSKKSDKSLLDDTPAAIDSGPGIASQTTVDTSIEMGDATVYLVADEDTTQFVGKKKGKKEKKMDKTSEDSDIEAILAELEAPKAVKSSQIEAESCRSVPPVKLEDVGGGAGKKTKKGKKSGRTAQEEEELDAILGELDASVPAPQPEAVKAVQQTSDGVSQPQQALADVIVTVTSEVPAETDGAEMAESAAAKKKKKKKEKEKAKAAAAGKQGDQADAEALLEEKQEAPKSKVQEKKVPKHVREMQERLAKQKELEERLRREEEERRRKEEEEQRRLEEIEREKEEAKRRRKEREKEKLLQKKREGKLLTGKQKEEARRLALMREQLLAQKGATEVDAPAKESIPKKPKYDTRKKRRPQGSEAVSQAEQLPEENDTQPPEEPPMEIEPAVEEPEVEPEMEVVEEEAEAEEEEDWDAKSWDDNIELPAIRNTFAEEEEANASSKKVFKKAEVQPSQDAPPPKRHISPQRIVAQKPISPRPEVKNQAQESEDESDSEDSTDGDEDDVKTRRHREAALKREARRAEALAKRSADDLRSPICCILGHVDTGKTKLLDCIRRTNVQEGEAGGITQQIGATYFPMENIRERTKDIKSDGALRVPGLLVIDTPGHESFTNLRSRGSGLCDIAILVVDIMHGLEPQTLESLNLLKMRHTPFVVALNKVDRLYNWKTTPNAPIRVALKQQSKDVVNEFEMRLSQIVTELKEQGMNSELYYKNREFKKVVSIVPTSAISGEGVPDLLMLLIHLTQKVMEDKLMYISEVQCTVLEVKVIEGLGTTIDVILVNGVLHEGDQIVVCGMQGPIVTTIRALLTPHPMKELRVKGSYQHHKELKAAQGIKITAQGLEHAIAGTQLYVVGPDDDLEEVKSEAMQDMKNVMSRVDKGGEGVCVQASTLGSLEALLEFLKSPAVKIPVSGISIGPVHKRDVMRASVMLEKKKEYATILAFDVKVTPEAKELAEELGVKIFMADIIYHLFDQFTAYMNNVKEEKRREVADEAVFPCVLSIKPQFVFNKKDPIILGVDVLEGIARVGTPLCVPSKEMILIGRIASMEVNHKVVETAKKGQAVAMKIVGSTPEETQKMYGRHFDHEDELVSHITRRSIDVLKESFRDELSVEEWKLVVKLKKLFNIP